MRKINAYNTILFIYLFLNSAFFLLYFFSGYVGGDLRVNTNNDIGYAIMDYSNLVLSYFLIVFVFVFISYIYFIPRFKYIVSSTFKYHVIFTFFILIWLLINYVYPIKLIDSGAIKYDIFSFTFNILFQPKYLFLIYIFYFSADIHTSRIFKLNLLIYFSFMLYSGYMGYMIYLFGFWFLEYRDKYSINKICIMLFLLILFSPILRIIKYYFLIVSNNSVDINIDDMFFMRNSNGYIDLYINMLLNVFERFQHIANVYFSLESRDYLLGKINSGYTGMFYVDGWYLYYLINNLSFSLNSYHEQIQTTLANLIYASVPWKVQIGLAGWFFEPLYFLGVILYSVVWIMITNIFNFFLKSRSVHLLSYYSIIILLCHGWFNDYVIYIQALIAFSIFIFFSRVRHENINAH